MTEAQEISTLFGSYSTSEISDIFNEAESRKPLILDNGDQFGYALFGSPTGFPVVLIPGVGINRMVGIAFHASAQALDLKIIAVDRPGVGLSTDHDVAPRTQEGCNRLAQLLKKLQITSFLLMGHSAGCLYALAASLYLKDSIVEPLVLLAPWVTPDQPGAKHVIRFASGYLPSFLLSFGARLNTLALRSVISSAPSFALSSLSASYGENEAKALESDAGKAALKLLLQSIGTGQTSGITKDVLLCLNRKGGVGFEYQMLSKRAIVIHGSDDVTVPYRSAECFVQAHAHILSLECVDKATHNLCFDLYAVRKALGLLNDSRKNLSTKKAVNQCVRE